MINYQIDQVILRGASSTIITDRILEVTRKMAKTRGGSTTLHTISIEMEEVNIITDTSMPLQLLTTKIVTIDMDATTSLITNTRKDKTLSVPEEEMLMTTETK
jgi:hypothetical protein